MVWTFVLYLQLVIIKSVALYTVIGKGQLFEVIGVCQLYRIIFLLFGPLPVTNKTIMVQKATSAKLVLVRGFYCRG